MKQETLPEKPTLNRIWLGLDSPDDPYLSDGYVWCEDNLWGAEGTEYLRADDAQAALAARVAELESENDRLRDECDVLRRLL